MCGNFPIAAIVFFSDKGHFPSVVTGIKISDIGPKTTPVRCTNVPRIVLLYLYGMWLQNLPCWVLTFSKNTMLQWLLILNNITCCKVLFTDPDWTNLTTEITSGFIKKAQQPTSLNVPRLFDLFARWCRLDSPITWFEPLWYFSFVLPKIKGVHSSPSSFASHSHWWNVYQEQVSNCNAKIILCALWAG